MAWFDVTATKHKAADAACGRDWFTGGCCCAACRCAREADGSVMNTLTPTPTEGQTMTTRRYTATWTRTKVAQIRAPGYPVGQPAPLTLNCPCGARPSTEPNGPDVLCACGTRYTSGGWIIDGSEG